MKFLFLNPPVGDGEIYMKELGRCGRKSVAGELWPQTGLAYLAAMVLQEGCNAKIIDAIAEGLSVDEVINKIKNCAQCVNGVIDIHGLRVRSSGGLYQMETHIVVDGRLTVSEGHRIAKAVESCLEEEIDYLDRVIIHVDPEIEKNKKK